MKIKIIDLIILTYRKKMPYKIMYEGEKYVYNEEFEEYVCCDHDLTPLLNIYNQYGLTILDDKVEILEKEKKEEKKIPEKLKKKKTIDGSFEGKTIYIYKYNEYEIGETINEIIDYLQYLKNKGDE